MTPEEYHRKFRVLDLMLSAHASLCERYRRRSIGLVLAVMALSILGATLALSDDSSVHILSVNLEPSEWLAILMGLVFFLSISELVLDLRGRAWAHEDAARRLGRLKGEFRRAEVDAVVVKTDGVDLDIEYDQTTAAIVEIPNSAFNRLKAKHLRKVAVSKRLDASPGAPLLVLRWRIFKDGLAGPGAANAKGDVLEEAPPGSDQPGGD